jgi:hypothetical protein
MVGNSAGVGYKNMSRNYFLNKKLPIQKVIKSAPRPVISKTSRFFVAKTIGRNSLNASKKVLSVSNKVISLGKKPFYTIGNTKYTRGVLAVGSMFVAANLSKNLYLKTFDKELQEKNQRAMDAATLEILLKRQTQS